MGMQSEVWTAIRNVIEINKRNCKLFSTYLYILKLKFHKKFMNLISQTQFASFMYIDIHTYIYLYIYLLKRFAATHTMHI
jgi:hypothetical protein